MGILTKHVGYKSHFVWEHFTTVLPKRWFLHLSSIKQGYRWEFKTNESLLTCASVLTKYINKDAWGNRELWSLWILIVWKNISATLVTSSSWNSHLKLKKLHQLNADLDCSSETCCLWLVSWRISAIERNMKSNSGCKWTCTSLQENMVFLTQKAMAHDICEINFVVSSITMYNMWCLLSHILD
jgi:hypothetical protein